MIQFDEYQGRASKTAIYPEEYGLEYTVLGLASEAGEVAGKLKKYIRDGMSYGDLETALVAELGDVLWYVAAVATELGVHLSTIAENNIAKLEDRSERNALSGSGDYR